MKSYMLMLGSWIIKYSLLPLRLVVMLYITVTCCHFTSSDSVRSEQQYTAPSSRGIILLGTWEKDDLKTHLTYLC